jgi:hypothetical protein
MIMMIMIIITVIMIIMMIVIMMMIMIMHHDDGRGADDVSRLCRCLGDSRSPPRSVRRIFLVIRSHSFS